MAIVNRGRKDTADVNLPIIPDKVIDRVREGKAVSLEEISAAASDMRSANAAARKAPVHAENLVPISREAAKLMVEGSQVPGQGLPMMPRSRPVIPAPFQRHRINADRHGKTWQTAKASTVTTGEMVKGVGMVTETWKEIRYTTRGEVLGVCFGDDMKLIDAAGQPVVNPDEKVAEGTDVYFRNAGGDMHKCDQNDVVEVHR